MKTIKWRLPMPQTFSELQCRLKQIEQERNGMSWYLSFRNPKNCQIEEKNDCKCIENREEKDKK